MADHLNSLQGRLPTSAMAAANTVKDVSTAEGKRTFHVARIRRPGTVLV